ncbi:MAG: hypothetical protein WC220_05530 [Pedobacter sp.]|jgi:hypothetical protein
MFTNTKFLHDKLLEDESLGKAETFINTKLFTASDTSLSYRLLNILGEEDLLVGKKKGKMDWRKFTFKELVYISILNELKKFGLKYEDLKSVKESFFNMKADQFNINGENPTLGDVLILYVFKGVEVSLIYFNPDEIFYVDPFTELALPKELQSFVHITLNPLVNRLWTRFGNESFPILVSNDSQSMKILHQQLTNKEEKVIELLRDKNNSSVKIKKESNDISLAYAEKTDSTLPNETPVSNLLRLLKSSDFEDIKITKRNGKIVNIKTEESIKL